MKNLLLRSLLGSNLTYFLIGSVVFLIIYFFITIKFIAKKLKTGGKLFVYSLPFTILLIVFLSMFFTASVNALYSSIYATNIGAIGGILNNAVTNYNPSIVQGQIGDIFSSVGSINPITFSNGLIWFILAIFIYFCFLFIVFNIVLKPLKSVQKNLSVLATGGEIKSLKLKGKDFSLIAQDVLKIQNNIFSLKNEISRMRADFNKLVPKQIVQLIGKKDISELSNGAYVQKKAHLMNIYFVMEEFDDLTKLTKVNKYFAIISPILRNYNGVIFDYNIHKTTCLFGTLDALNKATKALQEIDINNPEINIIAETKPITIAVVGYNKQYSIQILNN